MGEIGGGGVCVILYILGSLIYTYFDLRKSGILKQFDDGVFYKSIYKTPFIYIRNLLIFSFLSCVSILFFVPLLIGDAVIYYRKNREVKELNKKL